MVLANSHGGNVQVLATVARELRVRFGMLVVATQWGRFGLPGGMYDAVETQHGIHAGDIETSLMLEFRPDLVSMADAKNFVSSAIAMEKEFKNLSADGTHAFGWIAQDLNVEGAVGDASKATAAKGTKNRRTSGRGIHRPVARHDRIFSKPSLRRRCPSSSLTYPGPAERRYWLANARVPACVSAAPAVVLAPPDGEGVMKVDLS